MKIRFMPERLVRHSGMAVIVVVAALCCAGPGVAPAAAAYPDRPVHFIVPFSPGGATDGVARLVADGIAKNLGQQVVVENKPGAGAVVGISAAAKAAPDGYTMLLGNIALASAPALHKHLSFDPLKDFVGAVILARAPYVLVVTPQFPAHSVKELIALANAHPGRYNFASAGVGSSIHLAGELFKHDAKIDIVHIPYKGAGPAATALLGGRVPMMFGSLLQMTPLIKAGKVRALAITSAQRSSFLPDVPTLQEAGVAGYEVMGWYGIFLPKGTPAAIVARLNSAADQVLQSPQMKTKLQHYKLEAVGGTPADADKLLQDETAKWAEVIRSAHISAN
jgi:tripartite-type tricarboxylate transporter receptor subunit TctC